MYQLSLLGYTAGVKDMCYNTGIIGKYQAKSDIECQTFKILQFDQSVRWRVFLLITIKLCYAMLYSLK